VSRSEREHSGALPLLAGGAAPELGRSDRVVSPPSPQAFAGLVDFGVEMP